MERQQQLDLGVKHHKGVKRSLEKAIGKKSKAACKRDARSYRDKVCDVLNDCENDNILTLFDDHEIKNISSRFQVKIAGFHRFASRMRKNVYGCVDDVPFDVALHDCFNDMKVGDWKNMIAWIKEFMKTDITPCDEQVLEDLFRKTYYNMMMNRFGRVTWNQLLWIAANHHDVQKPDANIDYIVIGATDQKNWTPVQYKLLEMAKKFYPNAKVINVDDV